MKAGEAAGQRQCVLGQEVCNKSGVLPAQRAEERTAYRLAHSQISRYACVQRFLATQATDTSHN